MLIENQMRNKLVLAALNAKKVDHVCHAALKSYERGAGVKQVRDWDAKLSLRTYSKLKNDGVMG